MPAHPMIHLLHDLGAATWFGGSLMGATSLNAAASELSDPRERARISTAGWSRWAPVNAAGVAAHVVGGVGLLITDWQRVRTQEGVGRSTAIKTGVTGAALGVAAWSAALNRKMAAAGPVPVRGATEPAATTPPEVAKTQQQLKLVQWLNPLLAGAIVALGSWHEEQQRTSQQVPGLVKGVAGRPSLLLPALAAAGIGLAASRRQRSTTSAPPPAYPSPVSPPVTGTATTGQAGPPAGGTFGTPVAPSGTTSTDTTTGGSGPSR